jgi:lactate permease
VFGLRPSKTAWILWRSFKRMALSFLTICTLLALGYVIKFSGMDTTLGLAAARTQQGYPFLGPWIGFLGVAITGSATSSNVLFGSLQVVAAQAIGVNPVQMAAANVAGGVLGHIVSTSSMVVAAVATGSDAKSIGPIARGVVGYALALITAFSLWNTLVAYALPGLIPSYDIPE